MSSRMRNDCPCPSPTASCERGRRSSAGGQVTSNRHRAHPGRGDIRRAARTSWTRRISTPVWRRAVRRRRDRPRDGLGKRLRSAISAEERLARSPDQERPAGHLQPVEMAQERQIVAASACRSRSRDRARSFPPRFRRRRGRRSRASSQAATSPTTSRYAASCCMVRGVPCMCITTTPQSDAASTAAMSGSARTPLVSLMTSAPRSSAARATSALVVSTEMGSAICGRNARSTGTSRCNSSAAEIGSEPGRVDSAPRSSKSAPSSTSRSACAIAASGSRWRPPSEKLSGVTFTIPMSQGRGRASPVSTRLPRRKGPENEAGMHRAEARMRAYDRQGRAAC